jgi:20S proteasome subunit beta 2
MGSGSLAAMAVFESGWKANMSVRLPFFLLFNFILFTFLQRDAALQLVKDAISAGIFNDLGSGSNVDACIITASHTEMLRNVEMPNVRVQKERQYGFRRGTTAWKTEDIRNLVVSEEVTLIGAGDEMDTT